LPSGNLQSEYKLQKTITSLPALSANGAFRPTSDIPLPFETSLSEGLNFDVNMSPIENGVRLKNVSLRSENIILAAEGVISNILDLKGEALIDQPIAYEGYSLSGATEASFTVTGERAPT